MNGRDFSGEFYIVDFWKQTADVWQIIARYSSPRSKAPDRGGRQAPPPLDIDAQLTDTLGQLDARRLASDLAVVSFLLARPVGREGHGKRGERYVVDVWQQRGRRWQLIACYCSAKGSPFS